MNNINEKPTSAMEIETHNAESGYGYDEKGGLDRAGAIDAENIEQVECDVEKSYLLTTFQMFIFIYSE